MKQIARSMRWLAATAAVLFATGASAQEVMGDNGLNSVLRSCGLETAAADCARAG